MGGVTRPPLLLLALAFACVASSACSSSPAVTPPCAVSMGSGGADLTLLGSGTCATTLRLGLRVATGAPDAPVWSDATSSPVRVEGSWQLRDGAAVRDVKVTNPSAQPVTLVGLEWSTDGGGVGLAVDRMLHEGYQSWSYAGVEAIPPSIPDVLGTSPHGGDGEDILSELAGVSWWWSSLADAKNAGLVVGADGGTVFKTYGAANGPAPVRLRVVQGVTGDGLVLAPGESRVLDGLYLALGDVGQSLDAYARYVATKHPPASPRKPALGGWGSWNMYYANITPAALRDEAQFAAATLAPFGLKDFLLDDGYEAHWGSWAASPTFGVDLATLTAEQTVAGLRPALWLAPFYVNVVDPLIAQHPDWFLHKGGALRTYNNIGPDNAALDVTNPDARAYVTDALKQLRAWGYGTLKIDFLFGAALEGDRQQPVTSLESYALWMKTLREAVPDVHFVGCGAPTLPSVGWVDSMRIGPDVAYTTSPEPRYPFLLTQARQVAMRAHTDAWWALDPDVVLLRGAISDVEAWTVVVYSAMAGGNYLLGDPRQAGDLRRAMALAPDVVAMTRDGLAARPVALAGAIDPQLAPSPLFLGNHDTAIPHVWRKTSADGKRGWLAVFGWEVDGYGTEIDLPANAQELTAPAAPGPNGRQPFGGHHALTVPQHAARLFAW